MLRYLHNLCLGVALLGVPIAILDSLTQVLGHRIEGLSQLVMNVTGLVLLLLTSACLALFISRRVPFRVYAPSLLLTVWAMVGYWPLFPLTIEDPSRDLIMGGVWVLVMIDQVRVRRALGADRLGFFDAVYFAKSEPFPWQRVLMGLPLAGIGSILFAGFALITTAFVHINQEAGGFVHFRWDGVYSRHAIYKKDGQKVHLLSMVHMADRDFYARVINEIPRADSIVLTEGVTDKKGLLKENLDYTKPAALLGVEAQGRTFMKQLHALHKTLHADIDLSELRPQTLEGIRSIARIMDGELSFDFLSTFMDSNTMQHFESEILELRNDHLMDIFVEQEGRYEHIVMPWGGAHLKGIAERLELIGYQQTREIEMRAIDFRQVLRRGLHTF